jgi:hypothetical protein
LTPITRGAAKAFMSFEPISTIWTFFGIDVGGAQDRIGVLVQDLLDLGVTDQRFAALGGRRARRDDQPPRTTALIARRGNRPEWGLHAHFLCRPTPPTGRMVPP